MFPDFGRVFDADLVIGAMGQAFFSLSLGVGTMLIYGSYLSKRENMVSIGAMVALGGRRGSDFGRRTNYSCNVRSTSFRRTDI